MPVPEGSPGLTPRFARREEILPLRVEVIIAGTGRPPGFPGDDNPETRHAGIFDEEACVCCATFMREPWEGAPAWRVRGMATVPALRGRGLGRALLRFAERELACASGIALFWCQARASAVDFYRHAGWEVVSDSFHVENVGVHYIMVRRLPPDSRRFT